MKCKFQRNIKGFVPYAAPWFHGSLVVVIYVNMFLRRRHQVKLLQLLYLRNKVILILAAECGTLPSSEVYSAPHMLFFLNPNI